MITPAALPFQSCTVWEVVVSVPLVLPSVALVCHMGCVIMCLSNQHPTPDITLQASPVALLTLSTQSTVL